MRRLRARQWFVDSQRGHAECAGGCAHSGHANGGGSAPHGAHATAYSLPSAPVDVAHVEALVAQRAELRSLRVYARADAVLAELETMGVTVHDRGGRGGRGAARGAGRGTSRGSRDGDRGARGFPRELAVPREPADFGPLGHDYARAPDDLVGLASETLDEINRLLARRLAAKMARRFDEADQCLAELQTLGCVVNDKPPSWRADGCAFPSHTRVSSGEDDTHVDEAYVHALLEQRANARSQKDYITADALAAQLKAELNISLDDKRGTWCVGRMPHAIGRRA